MPKKEFNAGQEIEKHKKLMEELQIKDPFIYNLVKGAKFASIERLNNMLVKILRSLKDIEESFEALETNPNAYNQALEKYAKLLHGLSCRLDRTVAEQYEKNQID